MIGLQRPLFRQVIFFCLACLLFLAPIVARSVLEASSHLENGKQLLAQHSVTSAIAELRRSVEWRGLGNSAPVEAEKLLRGLSVDPSLSVDQQQDALENLKSGLRGSRSWLHPSSYTDPHSDAALLRQKLLAEAPTGGSAQAILSPRMDVHYGWQFTAQVAFWIWVLCFAHLAYSSVTRDGRIAQCKWALHITVIASSYIFWLLSLRFA
jgi:hypothetical protein